MIHFSDLDSGISYNAAPTAIQKLLDKVKARKKAAGETDTNKLSEKLDHLIQFQEPPIRWLHRVKGVKSIGTSPLGMAVRKNQNQRVGLNKLSKHMEDIAKGLEKFKFMSGKLDDLIQFGTDPRPRNPLGEFTGQEEGPNPNAMVKTYREAPAQPDVAPNKKSPVPGLAAAGGLAVLGGAGGELGGKAAKGALSKIGAALKRTRRV